MCGVALNKNYANFAVIPKFEKKEKRIFTAEERQILWEHSDDKRVQVILFMIYTGLRIGEVLKLRPCDIDLNENYIIGGEKTEAGRNRIVPFPKSIPEIKDFVKEWIAAVDNESLIFPQSINVFRRDVFYAPLVKYDLVDMTDPNHLTPHSTRHTFATLASSSGIKADVLQKVIGHSNYSTTANIYIHSDIVSLQNEMGKLQR